MKKDFIEKIKSRGYWRVNFEPLIYGSKLSLGGCKDIVEKNMVELRGWNYPHFPHRNDEGTGLLPGNNYYEGWIDWENHKEFWRMYMSGQFLHYLALREDWFDENKMFINSSDKIKPGSSLGIIGSIVYQLTEIFEFLSRLVECGLYDEGVSLKISLENTENRKLWIDASNRVPLVQEYKTIAKSIDFIKQFSKDDIVGNGKESAINAMMYVLERFGWKPSKEMLRGAQNNLYSNRY